VSGIDDLLEEARAQYRRLEPAEAAAAMREGAMLVDTRPYEQRQHDGAIPGAVVIDRNVLEWRLDPQGTHRIAELRGADQTVIVICNEGYSSSLAAATLRRVGLNGATDVIGGFQAWRQAGLPVTPLTD
jgi:rhodanese-related sulfurtransferase